MAYQLLYKIKNTDRIVLFYKRSISAIYKKTDFRFIDNIVIYRNKEKEDYIIFTNGKDSRLFKYIDLSNYSGRFYITKDIYYDIKINNITSKSKYLYLNKMFEPLDLEKILKIEVFDSNGAFVDSWENSELVEYTDKEKDIIETIKDNPVPFKINGKYTGYVTLSLLNPYELIIFDDLVHYGKIRTEIPYYQAIKLNQVETINEL